MAALTNAQYGAARRKLYSAAEAKGYLKSQSNLPNKSELRAALDVVPDLVEANKAVIKAQIDAAIGFTTTAAEANRIAKIGLLAYLGAI